MGQKQKHSSKNEFRKMASYISIFVLIVGLAIIYFAWQFSKSEIQRGQLNWQNRMSVVLSGRKDALESWLTLQKAPLKNLREGPSFSTYFSSTLALSKMKDGADNEAARDRRAQASYLLNQIKRLAEQKGFSNPLSSELQVSASVKHVPIAGIALTNEQGQMVLNTPNMPPVAPALAKYMAQGALNNPHDIISYGPYLTAEKHLVIAFISPIFDQTEAANLSGFLIAIKKLNQDFFSRLIQPGEVTKTAQNYLIRAQDGSKTIEYLSPLKDMPPQNFNNIYTSDGSNPVLAARFALDHVGDFTTRMNYKGEEVLITSQKIKGTDWILLRTIETNEVIAPLKNRSQNIILFALLTTLVLGLILYLLWRHGISIRLSDSLKEQKKLISKFAEINRFLRIVSDSQPTSITTVNEQGQYQFANKQASVNAQMKEIDMIGRNFDAILREEQATKIKRHCRDVSETGLSHSDIHSFLQEGEKITLKTDYIPIVLKTNTTQAGTQDEKGVLIVEENISPLIKERERREVALKTLVTTLAMIIDARDPHSSKHSERVAEVARIVAEQMGLDELTQNTVEIAGALMNLGKIFVPIEVLTRPGILKEEEIALIRDSVQKTADLLENVTFEGPVVETIRQAQLHSSLEEGDDFQENLLLSAHIVVVANVFVGMTSARAHRAGLDVRKATQILHAQSGTKFDPRPVAALLNYVENQNGYERWSKFSKPFS